jgi:transaldolase
VLWASTSTKNPVYPDTLYVEELIGQDTINTMPQATIDAYEDHGDPRPRLEESVEEARELLARLEGAGVSYEEVTDTCEREGVEKFDASFAQLMEGLREKHGSLAPA